MIQERLTERRRCTVKKVNGDRCGAFALRNETKCVWHSKSKRAKKAKNKQYEIKSNKDLINILQKEINRIKKKNTTGSVLKRAGEIRQFVQLIAELKGVKKKTQVDDVSQIDSFASKVGRAKKRKDEKR